MLLSRYYGLQFDNLSLKFIVIVHLYLLQANEQILSQDSFGAYAIDATVAASVTIRVKDEWREGD
jgi:hypothetical protein